MVIITLVEQELQQHQQQNNSPLNEIAKPEEITFSENLKKLFLKAEEIFSNEIA